MVSDPNPSVLITMAHDKLRQHLRSLCIYVSKQMVNYSIFMTKTTVPNSFSVISITPHLLLWPVMVLYKFWFTEVGDEAGIGWKLLVCKGRIISKLTVTPPLRLWGQRYTASRPEHHLCGCVRSEKCLQQHQQHGPIESLELSGTHSIMCPQSQTQKEWWLWGRIHQNPLYKHS